jgi:hypothetical protein
MANYAIAASSAAASSAAGATGGKRKSASGLSSAATRQRRSTPQPLQRWTIICSPSGRKSVPTGAISDRQGLIRSPGRRASTWRDVRQTGQWLRCRPPETVGPTKARQRPQRNGSRSLRRIRGRNGGSAFVRGWFGRAGRAAGKDGSSPSSRRATASLDKRGTGRSSDDGRQMARNSRSKDTDPDHVAFLHTRRPWTAANGRSRREHDETKPCANRRGDAWSEAELRGKRKVRLAGLLRRHGAGLDRDQRGGHRLLPVCGIVTARQRGAPPDAAYLLTATRSSRRHARTRQRFGSGPLVGALLAAPGGPQEHNRVGRQPSSIGLRATGRSKCHRL